MAHQAESSDWKKKDLWTAILRRKKSMNCRVVDEAVNDDNYVVAMNPETMEKLQLIHPASDLPQLMDTSESRAHNPSAAASHLIEAARAYDREARAYDLSEKTIKWRLVRRCDEFLEEQG
ncbi:hypothetical protein ACFX15_037633 [Malus domestica]